MKQHAAVGGGGVAVAAACSSSSNNNNEVYQLQLMNKITKARQIKGAPSIMRHSNICMQEQQKHAAAAAAAAAAATETSATTEACNSIRSMQQ